MNQPIDILKKYWGYDSFRSLQEEIINSVLNKKDTIALLPTSGGKSLCYQIPALLSEGVCVVISPLISLMRDQIENLNKRNIKAITIQNSITIDEIVALFDNLKYGSTKFLYISPERLQSDIIIQKLKEVKISLIAVDEAHCISEWGHDFRPSYRKIKNIRSLFPEVTIIALSATATQKVIEDIKDNLELENVNTFKKSFYRDNLAYQIFTKENKLQTLERVFKKNSSPTIVYVNSRKKTEEISNYMNNKGYKTLPYHGGMLMKDKSDTFDSWMKEENPIIIATNAFGMGIDKSNVRVVAHLDLPNSIENYVQEAGRGGRDGKKAFSIVLQNENDINSFKEKVLSQTPNLKEIKEVHKNLYQYFQIARGEKVDDPFEFNFFEFCDRYQLNNKKASNSLQLLKNNEIIDLHDTFHQKSAIQFILSSKQLQHYNTTNQLESKLIELLLRSYGGIFQKEVNINEFVLAKKIATTSREVKRILKQLHQKEVVIYKEMSSNQELYFLLPREDDKTINRVSKTIQLYLNQQIEKAKKLIQFINNNEVCRSLQLLHYFNESSTDKCGICDVCISNKKSDLTSLPEEILSLFEKRKKLSQIEIMHHLKAKEDAILIHLRSFLAKDILGLTNDNKLYLK